MVKRLFFCLFMWGMCSGLSAQTLEGPLPFFRSFLDGNLTKTRFPNPMNPGLPVGIQKETTRERTERQKVFGDYN